MADDNKTKQLALGIQQQQEEERPKMLKVVADDNIAKLKVLQKEEKPKDKAKKGVTQQEIDRMKSRIQECFAKFFIVKKYSSNQVLQQEETASDDMSTKTVNPFEDPLFNMIVRTNLVNLQVRKVRQK